MQLKILDLDMDYFLDIVLTGINEDETERLSKEFDNYVWNEERVRSFLERNLGLSVQNKKRGRVVVGHNESLYFWKELIRKEKLTIPFEVVHIDSHADLGLGYSSWSYMIKYLLQYPVEERPKYN